MRSDELGTSTSAPEVTNVSQHGFWLLLDGAERFLPFSSFPWFAQATIAQILKVERPLSHHLYWPELDVDLHVDSLDRPENYPLVSGSGRGSSA
jgi:hypothetical protein